MPPWVDDLANVLGIAEFLWGIAIFVFPPVLGWILQSSLPPPSRIAPRKEGAPQHPSTLVPLGNFILIAIVHQIIRPEIPVGQDILRVAGGYVCLIVAAGGFVWGAIGPELGLIRLAQSVLVYAMLGFFLWLVILTARLFWKIDYMRGKPHEDD